MMTMMTKRTFFFFAALIVWSTSFGAVQLPQLFQSGMVLQRGKPIPVWGTANPQELVSVSWQKKTYTALAGADGRWRIDLPATKAGGPYVLTVSTVGASGGAAGPVTGAVTLTDVMVGDVWLLSGQSNIDVTIERVYPQYADEIDGFDNSNIRLFRVQNETATHGPKSDIRPTAINWKPLTKQNAWLFSAVGTFLGKRMWEKNHVAQGIIVNSWGGTPIEAWLPADSLQRDYPQLVSKVQLYDNLDFIKAQQHANQLANDRWSALLDEQDPGIAGRFSALDCDDSNWAVVNQDEWKWRGIGSTWLRQYVIIDKAHAGQPARLLLGTLFDADITYVNGRQVGRTYYQYPPRRYDIPEGVLREGVNVIAVRFINKYGSAHFIPQKPYMLCFGPDRFSQNPMPKDVIPLDKLWRNHDGAAMPPCPSGDVSLQNMATTLYNAVVHPLAPFAVSGVVWYQGESNTGNPKPYADLLRKLMGSWRTLWQEPALPFCIVQLANYDGRQQTGNPSPITDQTSPVNSNWAQLREAQRTVARDDAYAELACIIDLGETVDIHPLRKREVAERVGLCFDRLVFNDKKVKLSPKLLTAVTAEGMVTLTFDQPLGEGAIGDCEYADEMGAFHNANATATGSRLVISIPSGRPVAIRYAWKDNPVLANLCSAAGLPVAPFEHRIDY